MTASGVQSLSPTPDNHLDRALLLGMGWSVEEGGLNRYLRGLLTSIRSAGDSTPACRWRADAVVLGPGPDSHLPPGVTPAGASGSPLLVRVARFWAVANRVSPGTSVVDSHFALYSILPLTVGALRKCPLVVHFQGPWAGESTAAGHGLASVKAKQLVERLVYRRAAEIVTLSAAFRRLLVERYGISPWHIHVIPPGVDLTHFKPGDWAMARQGLNLPCDAWIAVVVRRLVSRMGVDVLLRAWAQLRPRSVSPILLVVGTGPERARLEALTTELGIEDTVRFLGSLGDEALVDCYRAADISIVPSLALEGFGLVVLEALASGTPVVGTDAGGLPEVLAGLDKGLIVRAGDRDALARRLLGAIDGSEPLPGPAACRSHAERFTWSEAAHRNLAVYERAVRPRHRSRLRVVYLDHCARLSGGELAMLRLLPALSEVDAHVILAEDGPLAAQLTQAGISVEVLPMAEAARGMHRDRLRVGHFPAHTAVAAATHAIRLRSRLAHLRPDLVHTNSLKAALYGGVASRAAGIPAIWHIRDRVEEDYLPRPAVSLIRLLARHIPSAVVANSRSTLATLHLPAGQGTVVPSPIGPYLTCASPRAPHRPLQVGMVGRIAPWKGQHIFVDAFSRAFPNGPEQATIIGSPMFGTDEETYEKALHRQINDHGLEARIKLVGFRHDVAAELDRLDVLVHASIIPEPFGQVVVEGMSAGLAVVAAGDGGPAEIVTHGVDGLLYPPGDACALTTALGRLAGDGNLRQALGSAARKRAEEFRPQRVAEEVTEVYREVLRQA